MTFKLNKIFKSALFLIAFFIPNIVFGQLRINEIMYDIEGTDSGREWIEIHNIGNTELDLTNFYFRENEVNHKITKFEEYNSGPILPNGYAIIADNPAKFIVDNPSYNGILFDSAFSLNNTGEVLAIVDNENNIIHSVNYSPEWGAKGTGNTLQFSGDKWIPAIKTPGALNADKPVNEDVENDKTDDDAPAGTGSSGGSSSKPSESSHSGQNELSNVVEKIALKIGAGRDRFAIINSPINFRAISNQDKPNKVKYIWSFGDASTQKNRNVDHIYYYEGEYNVVLNAELAEEDATTRAKITVRKPDINISLISGGKLVDILLENNSTFEVNFGGFYFKLENQNQKKQSFYIPKDTIVSPKSNITIPAEISNLSMNQEFNTKVTMYYPNGKFAVKNDLLAVGNFDAINTQEFLEAVRPHINPSKKEEFENIIQLLTN